MTRKLRIEDDRFERLGVATMRRREHARAPPSTSALADCPSGAGRERWSLIGGVRTWRKAVSVIQRRVRRMARRGERLRRAFSETVFSPRADR